MHIREKEKRTHCFTTKGKAAGVVRLEQAHERLSTMEEQHVRGVAGCWRNSRIAAVPVGTKTRQWCKEKATAASGILRKAGV